MTGKITRICDECGSSKGRINNSKKFGMMLCDKHYQQMKTHGHILKTTKYDSNEIVINNGYAEIVLKNKDGNEVARAKIGIEDIDRISKYKWGFDSSIGYVATKPNGKNIKIHRIIIETKMPTIDHINGDKLDNRKTNLRAATKSQNAMNSQKSSRNKSGYKGVSWDNKSKKWSANIHINRKKIFLGYFADIKDAIEARKAAELKYFGEFAYQKVSA